MSSGTGYVVRVQVPPGAFAGDSLAIPGPDGNQYQVVVPPGIGPGGLFEAELPIPAYLQAAPMGVPISQQLRPAVRAPQPQVIVYNQEIVLASEAEFRHKLLPDSIDESKLILMKGLCCCNTSFLVHDGCFGCAAKIGICCLEAETCFKCSTPPLRCCCCQLRCVPSRNATCLKGQLQTCCIVTSCAFPPDEEVPFTLACCFWSCVPACGCCATLGDLTRDPSATVVVQREQVVIR
jgi:hypothetical protein